MVDLSDSREREGWHVEKIRQEARPLSTASPLDCLIATKGSHGGLLPAARLATISGNESTLGARQFIFDNLV